MLQLTGHFWQVLDVLQNKDGKALVLTSSSAVYLDLAHNRIRWAFPLAALVGVGSTGPFLTLRAWLGLTGPYPNPCALVGLHRSGVNEKCRFRML